MTILVTGATGTVGREVVKQLAERGAEVRAMTRDPAKAKLPSGVEAVKGDYDDPTSLDAAVRGAEAVFVLSTGTNLTTQEKALVDAAKRAGVKRLVKLSVLGAQSEAVPFAKWHRASEKHIEQSGIPWTFVRATGFMSNAFFAVDTIKKDGAIYRPTGEGKLAIIDPRDIAAVAVKALTEPGHEKKAYDVTGSEALSGADEAAVLSRAIGKPVKFVDVPPSAAREAMVGAGMPAAYVDALLAYYAAVKDGHAAATSDAVQKVTGKAPRTFEQWAKDHAAAFR